MRVHVDFRSLAIPRSAMSWTVRHERKGGIENIETNDSELCPRWRRPSGTALPGEVPNRLQAASAKSRGSERCGKRQAISLSGESRGDERERTNRRHVENVQMTSKPGGVNVPGQVREEPADGPDGVRRKGGVTSVQARAWNVGTRLPISTGQWSASARTPRD